MFTLMFWNKAGEALLIEDKQSMLFYNLYGLAYGAANKFLPEMAKKGAVSMTITNPNECVYDEYPIINDDGYEMKVEF